MGGKRKQANRTKNNARPANSGRSAELLGSAPAPFVGFSAVKDGAFVTVLPGFSSNVDDINPDVDPNFQLLLKKMNKKDSTTKLKALQEFSDLVRDSEVEAIKAVLPFWPRLYCQLATDAEHRVREALHQAQRAVVLKAKRNIAPYLKQLAGPWFTSQYDTYAPAATAAKQAFQEAFPPNKLLEAINFCQEEILAYITDNLTVQTAQTLSNPKTTSVEDMEAKHQRVLISSLQGYVLYLRKLSTEQLATALASNQKLISSGKYWKLAKHPAPLVRSAWFTAIIALCQKSPDLIIAEAPRVVMATLGRLDESDPTVLPIVWEAALHVMTTIPDCWPHVNADKVVLPKLYLLLREGGQGNAGAIFPNLLPFLSKLPPNVMNDRQGFYDKFFTNMRTGFIQKCVVQSPSESSAVAKCYVECLKYAIVTSQEHTDFCQYLIKVQLMPAVRLALRDPRLNLFYTTHFTQISLLVHQWDRNRSVALNALLVEQFWTSMEELNVECLTPAREDSLEPQYVPPLFLLERQVALCLYLKNPAQRRPVQNLRVKFSCEGQENVKALNQNPASCTTTDDHSNDFNTEIYRLVESICVTYFSLTKSGNTPHFLVYLSKLVMVFDSKKLFVRFMDPDNSETPTESKALIDLFVNPLQDWLGSEEMGIEPTINLTFMALKHMEPHEKNIVLGTMGQLCLGPSVENCLTAALKHRDEDSVCSFLQGELVCSALVMLAHEVCTGSEDACEWELLRQCCVSKTRTGEFVIPDKTICDIVDAFEQEVASNNEVEALPTIALACVLFTERLNEATMPMAEDFFLHLLGLSIVSSDYTLAVERAAKIFVEQNRLDIMMEKVAAFVGQELKFKFKHGESVKLGYKIDTDLLAVAVHRFLVAASSDPTPVEITRRFLEICSKQLSALDPILLYFSKNYFQRWELHKAQGNPGCQCRSLKVTKGFTFNQALDLYLGSLLFHFLLIEKLMLGVRAGSSDSTDEDKTEEEEKKRTSCETFEALEDHITMLKNSLEVCNAFAARYASTVYNYKISTIHMTLFRICYVLRKLDVLKIDMVLFQKNTSSAKVGLRLPWNQLPNEPFTPSATSSEDPTSSKAVEQPTPLPSTKEVAIEAVTCWSAYLGDFSVNGSDPEDLLDTIIPLDRTHFLFECDVSEKPELQVLTMAATARYMAKLIICRHHQLKLKHWDFITISLASWVQSLGKSKHNIFIPLLAFPIHPANDRVIHQLVSECNDHCNAGQDEKTEPDGVEQKIEDTLPHNHNVAVLTEAVCELLFSFYRYMNSSPSDEEEQQALIKMKEEWANVFEQDSNNVVVDIYIAIVECSLQRELSLLDLPVIEAVAVALETFDVTVCTNQQSLLDCCLKTSCSPIVVLMLAAFHVLHDFVPSLVNKDSEILSKSDDPTDLPTLLNLRQLLPYLDETQVVVVAMLVGVRVGDSIIVTPYTDGSTYALSYLMMWTVALYMCEKADSALRSQYAAILRDEHYLDLLLRAVFRLMPDEVLAVSHGKNRSRKTLELFSTPPKIDEEMIMTSTLLEQTSCWVYWLCLCRLPAEVRSWWSSIDPRYCSLVDRVTTNHVSPTLCEVEMKTVQSHVAKQKTNMTIKVHASVNEVHAVYTVDEARLEMAMFLPANYPLGQVAIDTKNTEKLQDSGKEGRGWLMQLRMFLSHQNGSLWEGLSLWKSNLDKRFEGVEECFICYSILHGSNFQLPKVTCRTCKKKFHSGCMYKWFSTSNKPTCPICRNQF